LFSNFFFFFIFKKNTVSFNFFFIFMYLFFFLIFKKKSLYFFNYENIYFYFIFSFFDAKLSIFFFFIFLLIFLNFFNFKINFFFFYFYFLNFFLKVILKTRYENSLIDGLLYIHPLCINLSYFFLFLLICYFLNKNYKKNWFNSWNQDIFFYFFLWTSVSIILGALWAQNELNWGGYWSWDQVEIISLFYFCIAIFLLHFNRNFTFFSFLFFFLFFFLGLRFGYFTSIHSFVSKNNNSFFYNFFFFFNFFIVFFFFLKYFYKFEFEDIYKVVTLIFY
jgi:cytochrome c biogenesis factor